MIVQFEIAMNDQINDQHTNSIKQDITIKLETVQLEEDIDEQPIIIKKLTQNRYADNKSQKNSSYMRVSAEELIWHPQKNINNQIHINEFSEDDLGLEMIDQSIRQEIKNIKKLYADYGMIKDLQNNNKNGSVLSEAKHLPPRRKAKSSEIEVQGIFVWRNYQQDDHKPQTEFKRQSRKIKKQSRVLKIRKLRDLQILSEPLNTHIFDTQLIISLKIKHNKFIEISKVAATSLIQQPHFCEGDDDNLNQEQTLKFRIDRLLSKIKITVIVIGDDKQERNWKEVQLPITSNEINQIVITEKKDGRIRLEYDQYEFSFNFGVSDHRQLFYGLRNTCEIKQMKLEYNPESKQVDDVGCESKCLIF